MAFILLTFYTILLLVRPQEWSALGMENVPVVQFTLIGCLAIYPFISNKNLGVPQAWLMIVFMIVLFISVIVGVGWLGGAIALSQDFLQQSFIPFMLISGVLSTLNRQYVVFGIIAFAAFFMVYNGHVQTVSENGMGLVGNFMIEAQGAKRITYLGILNDPNDLGMFLVMAIPPVLLLKSRSGAILRMVYWCIAAAILYGIYLTNSRGTLLAVVALFGFWYWNRYGTKKTMYAMFPASPVLLFIISNFREIDVEEAGAQGRIDAWYAGYQMLISNPLLGVGHRQFTEYHYETAHNSFVLVFSEMGLLGCIIWVAILVSTVTILIDISKKKYLPEDLVLEPARAEVVEKESQIALTLLYSFLAFGVSGFFLSRSYIPILYMYIGMAVATTGRVMLAFPEGNLKFKTSAIVKFSVMITIAGVIGVYVLVRVGL